MTGNVEDQKTWINAKMNLTRTFTNEQTRRREEEILDRIIPTGIMDLDEDFDKEETDNLSECRTYDHDMDQEVDFVDYQVYPFSLPEQEKSDKFINEDTEEEDIQSLESLEVSYQNYKKQNEENVNSLSLTTKSDEQLDRAGYFTELDVRWKYNNRHTEDEDQWKIDFRTNQELFDPTDISSSLYNSPTTSLTRIDKMNEQ
jgi:hypothetical protein